MRADGGLTSYSTAAIGERNSDARAAAPEKICAYNV